MRYAKLIDGYPRYHGNSNPIVNADGTETITADDARLRAAGFMPVIRVSCPPPREGYYYAHSWGVSDGAITDIWTEGQEHEPDDEA